MYFFKKQELCPLNRESTNERRERKLGLNPDEIFSVTGTFSKRIDEEDFTKVQKEKKSFWKLLEWKKIPWQ